MKKIITSIFILMFYLGCSPSQKDVLFANASDEQIIEWGIVKARWAGKSHGKQYPITLRIVGHDDIGIVTNITSIINKENDILLRSISIDSHDGLFSGMMTVMVDDTSKLESLVKKIKTVKGVKQVNRG